MAIKIALAGNPNCGKTTMFNDLTGSSQYVGNWPGVTVEKKEGKLIGHKKDVVITDLPGIYSLSPYTPEEVVSRNYLTNERPNAILNLVDGTNLERNLYLTTQLVELGIPVVVALNMMDLVKKNGDHIDSQKLGAALGCAVVETSALKGNGSREAAQKAIDLAGQGSPQPAPHEFSKPVEDALCQIEELLAGKVDQRQLRWYSIKVFEGDEKVLEELGWSDQAQVREIVAAVEKQLDDDSESIITNERYAYIGKLMHNCVHKKRKGLTISDKIDRVVTNRFLALPIFIAIMFSVYFLSVTSLGTVFTDWANDGLFGGEVGSGWHLFMIGDGAYQDAAGQYEALAGAASEAGVDLDAAAEQGLSLSAAAQKAGVDLNALAKQAHVGLGALTADGEVAEPDPASYGVWVPSIYTLVGTALEGAQTPDWLNGLLLDGIITGVGSVLGFVPQMLILFLLLAILEDCGYMARVAFIMDRIFRRFGLSGKSFIPMMISMGCGVPGIMSTKTIENEKDRRMTIMTTTFIPCGAKLPIIALMMGALMGDGSISSWWLSPLFYFLGVAAVIVSGIILKKTRPFAGDPAPFVMELPQYHLPALKGVLIHMWERAKSFIIKAGTVIFAAVIVIWFLSNFGWANGGSTFGMLNMDDPNVNQMDYSILAYIGSAICGLFAPLGFGNWQATVATISGLIAKENVVGTFGVLFGIGNGTETDPGMWAAVGQMLPGTAAVMSFLAFNLLCAPCFAAMGAIKRQMASAKWTFFAIAYMCVFAYAVALLIFQFGTLFATGQFTIGTVVALVVLALLLYLLLRPSPERKLARRRVTA